MSKSDSDFTEQQYVLRLPPELAERVQNAIIDIPQKRIEEKINLENIREDTLSIEFDSERHGVLYFSHFSEQKNVMIHEQYECLIVDLPTVVESYISVDLETYYKCGQVVKMILVTTEEFETKQRMRMKHLIQNLDPIIKEETAQPSVQTFALPPHMQQKHMNEQKRERELQEERELQQRRAEEERRKREHEQAVKESDFDPNIYHSGLTPSLVNIYEHWEKTKVTVTPDEVKRMEENYYTWLFDEKEFKIERITEDNNGSEQIQTLDDYEVSENSDDEMKGIEQEMSVEDEYEEAYEEAYSDSNDDYSMSSKSDMDDSSSIDTQMEVSKRLDELKRRKDLLLQNLNNTNIKINNLTRQINETKHDILRSELKTALEAEQTKALNYRNELNTLNNQIKSFRQ